MTIADLEVGDEARVVDIDPANELRRRLMELGITPGTMLRVVRIAPMGDPLEVFLRGYRLSLRKADAGSIRCTQR